VYSHIQAAASLLPVIYHPELKKAIRHMCLLTSHLLWRLDDLTQDAEVGLMGGQGEHDQVSILCSSRHSSKEAMQRLIPLTRDDSRCSKYQ
jgi:hypothetical protein